MHLHFGRWLRRISLGMAFEGSGDKGRDALLGSGVCLVGCVFSLDFSLHSRKMVPISAIHIWHVTFISLSFLFYSTTKSLLGIYQYHVIFLYCRIKFFLFWTIDSIIFHLVLIQIIQHSKIAGLRVVFLHI
jgi:hypothetical protein